MREGSVWFDSVWIFSINHKTKQKEWEHRSLGPQKHIREPQLWWICQHKHHLNSMERFYPAFAWLCMHLRHAPWEFWCDDKIRRRTTNSTMSWKSWKISFDKRLFSLVRRAWIVMSLSGCTNCDWKKPQAGSGNWCGEGLKQQRGSSPRVCLQNAIGGTLKFRFWHVLTDFIIFYIVRFF